MYKTPPPLGEVSLEQKHTHTTKKGPPGSVHGQTKSFCAICVLVMLSLLHRLYLVWIWPCAHVPRAGYVSQFENSPKRYYHDVQAPARPSIVAPVIKKGVLRACASFYLPQWAPQSLEGYGRMPSSIKSS